MTSQPMPIQPDLGSPDGSFLGEAQGFLATLDHVATNVFVANLDLELIYLNHKARRTLGAIAEPFRRAFGLSVEEVLGGSIHRFHRDPERVERILRDPSYLPHQASFTFGEITLQTNIAGVYGDSGRLIGYVVNWEDVSEEERRKEEKLAAEEREREMTADLKRVLGQVSELAETLSSASDELAATGSQLGNNASETSSQATLVSSAAEQVSQSISSVASSSEEMSASIREIAQNANDATRVAGSAVELADRTNTQISKLGDSSVEIGKVIKVITSIAQQTNLLALNATIEAARAGEAGKGFAVVANEVKELANQTARATEEISQKIEGIQTDTRGAVEAIGEITDIISDIDGLQTAIASAVEEQTATTNEIGRNVAEAAEGSGEIARNISKVAEHAEDTTHGVAESLQAAEELARLAGDLRETVSGFRIDGEEA
ncbi:MAG: methyl-accepting chemotaxis protein [Myxococcota bacterium]